MPVACFGITLPVGEMFEGDLNAHSWFAEQIKKRDGKLEWLGEPRRCTLLVKVSGRYYMFVQARVSTGPPAGIEISHIITKSGLRSLVNTLGTSN